MEFLDLKPKKLPHFLKFWRVKIWFLFKFLLYYLYKVEGEPKSASSQVMSGSTPQVMQFDSARWGCNYLIKLLPLLLDKIEKQKIDFSLKFCYTIYTVKNFDNLTIFVCL